MHHDIPYRHMVETWKIYLKNTKSDKHCNWFRDMIINVIALLDILSISVEY